MAGGNKLGSASTTLSTESPWLTTQKSTVFPDDISSGPLQAQASTYYILLPLTLVAILLLAAALVYLIIRKHRLDELRHTLMPLYSFDPADEGEEDWEAELIDPAMARPSVLHPTTMVHKGYRSVDSPDTSLSGPYQV